MSGSTVARQLNIARGLQRDHQRIRRLEVNRPPGVVVCGVAAYDMDWTGLTAADTFTPDLSTLANNTVIAADTIGCVPEATSLRIPAGWFWWASLVLQVKTSGPPPTGEFLSWSAINREGFGTIRTDPMVDSSTTAQKFGATVSASPSPCADTRFGLTPLETRNRMTVCARFSESR